MSVNLKPRPIPVRPYNRFTPGKVCDSGIDPIKNLTHSFKRESTLDAHRYDRIGTRAVIDSPIPRGKVPYGTTKCTYKLGLSSDAKLDRFQMGISTKVFPKNPTDKFSGDPVAANRPFQGIFDQIVKKPDFDRNAASPNPWVPKKAPTCIVNNRSGTSLNIINHEPNVHSAVLLNQHQQTHNKTKGITEIRDLARPAALNIS